MKRAAKVLAGLFAAVVLLTPASASALWEDAPQAGGNWRFSPWFGWVNTTYSPWVYHLQHQWLYPAGSSEEGLWFYSLDMEWLYTGRNLYPFFYSHQKQAWLWYLRDTTNPRWFFNYATQHWENDLTGHAGEGVQLTSGAETVVTNFPVGNQGGEITISNGPLSGVTIEVPPGALPSNVVLTVSFNDGTVTPRSGTFSGRVIELRSSGMSTFEEPVRITVPYANSGAVVPVPYYVDSNGHLQACQLVSIDRVAGTMTFETFHASLFTDILAALSPEGGHSTYRPATDGFQVGNPGSIYNPAGECFGISAFAQWYFRNMPGGFYSKYMQDVPTLSGGTIKGQSIIATRAHTSVVRMWNSYLPSVSAQYNLTPAEIRASIVNIIDNTAIPTILYMRHIVAADPGAHAILAYDHNDLGTIAINDPNHPGVAQTMQYNAASSNFMAYHGWTNWVVVGDGSLRTESFLSIYGDAEAGFNGTNAAQVNVTSHTNREQVMQRNVTLAGNITSGQLLVDKLEVLVNQTTKFETAVPAAGNFSIPLSLVNGTNDLYFVTKGTIRSNGGDRVAVALNTQVSPFQLFYLTNAAVILVTLTWNTGNTDLDLYVIDPTGDSSWYSHKVTADGGELDFDDTNGYGPEHWTLTTTDTTRWNQDYRVRVHYYSDHQTGTPEPPAIASSWTVTVMLYENTTRMQTLSFSGVLAAENSGNHYPADAGADWNDVVTIRPVQAGLLPHPVIERSPKGPVILTVPMPSPAECLKAKAAAEARGDAR